MLHVARKNYSSLTLFIFYEVWPRAPFLCWRRPITCRVCHVCALSQRSYKPIFCILPAKNVGFVKIEKAVEQRGSFLLLRPRIDSVTLELSMDFTFFVHFVAQWLLWFLYAHTSYRTKDRDVLNTFANWQLFLLCGYTAFCWCLCCCVLIILPESADVNGLANKWVCYMLVRVSEWVSWI